MTNLDPTTDRGPTQNNLDTPMSGGMTSGTDLVGNSLTQGMLRSAATGDDADAAIMNSGDSSTGALNEGTDPPPNAGSTDLPLVDE